MTWCSDMLHQSSARALAFKTHSVEDEPTWRRDSHHPFFLCITILVSQTDQPVSHRDTSLSSIKKGIYLNHSPDRAGEYAG